MKILFVTNAKGPDYMADMVFHGGKSIFKTDFIETNKLWYMYDDVPNKENLYGKGFTIYGRLSKQTYSPLEGKINELIENKFFQKVIYGSIWRCNDYFDLVSKVYHKNDIIIIDGEDELDKINNFYINKGKYYKREYSNFVENVYPINFGIPKELVLEKIVEKEKLISDIVPNFNKNYTFNTETDYYKEYSKSWYAQTQKKGGWDCLRHYEIMMNGCIPIFENLENCPKNCLTKLPKKEIIDFSKDKKMDKTQNDFILEYTKNNLTTINIINDLLQ
jgi:hypothetical protein